MNKRKRNIRKSGCFPFENDNEIIIQFTIRTKYHMNDLISVRRTKFT